jgi:heptaprenyl diphosphate synthase
MAVSSIDIDTLAKRRNGTQVQLVPSSIGEILQRAELVDDLAAIEQLLLDRTRSRSELLSTSGAYTVAAGGKRLRAAFVLLAARLVQHHFERASHPAVAVELLHAASLIHDDLVDRAGQRRGRTTVHNRWDKDVALMLGDYLFALAANELAHEPDPRIIRFYVSAAQTMVEGELSPVVQLQPMDVALSQYWRKIGSKTAVLFEAACKSGIAVVGGSNEQIEALGSFGYELGLAFQVVDDVLDFVGDEHVLGKPAGNDLREGTLTLPLIYAVDQASDPLLREVALTAHPDRARIPQLLEAVLANDGHIRAMADARMLIDRARSHLMIFPNSPARRALFELCEFVLNRQQ